MQGHKWRHTRQQERRKYSRSIHKPACYYDKDAEDIKFGISQDIDYIAASFIRRASDVLAIKELLSEHQGNRLKLSLNENQEV